MNFTAKETELNNETSRLFKQAAHDIRSPLSVLSLMAASENVEMSDEVRELLKAAVKRINDIATELLAADTKSETKSAKASVEQVVEGIVSEKKILAKAKNVEFQVIYKGNKKASLPDLGGKLERALSNLIDNSLEAIVHHAGKIVISVKEKMGRIFLSITDNGKGIPKRILANIGTEGFSFGKDQKKSGFGLGVHQAKSAAQAMGGALKLFSTEGRGTTVVLALPGL